MNFRRIIPYPFVFLAGFAAAWMVKTHGVLPVVATQAQSKFPQPRTSKTRSETSKADAQKKRMVDLFKKLDEAGFTDYRIAATMSEMETPELLALIQLISEKAGLTGLDFTDANKINELVIEWSKRDLDAALIWVDALTTPKDRKNLLHAVIGNVAETDIDHAVNLTLEHCRNEKGEIDVPLSLMKKVYALDPDEMLKRAAFFVNPIGGVSSGSGVELPADYEFCKALDGLAALELSLEQINKSLVIYPNLIEQWTKHDPDAAWQWLGEGKKVDFNDVGCFLNGYFPISTPEQSAKKLIQARDLFPSENLYYQTVWSVVVQAQNREIIQRFFEETPSNPQESMNLLFAESFDSWGDPCDKAKELLLSQMSPSQRVIAFTHVTNKISSHGRTEFFTSILKRLGHSESEIQQMIPPEKPSK